MTVAYNEALQQLGEETAGAVLVLYDQLLDGTVSRETFDRQLRHVLDRQSAAADNIAALSMSAWLLKETGEAVIARPAVAAADRVQSAKALAKLTDAAAAEPSKTIRYTIERSARDYGTARGQESFHGQMKQSKRARSWTRKPNARACPLCVQWANENVAFPVGVKMGRHSGCSCSQVPSTAPPFGMIKQESGA